MGRVIDLDDRGAAQREATDEPVRIILNRQEWRLPSQLPASVLDPLFEGELDDLLALLIDLYGDGDEGSKVDPGKLMATLARNPKLLSTTLRAIKRAFEELFGEEQWTRWLATRPALSDYVRLARAAFSQYGVGLGEALGLSSSSANAGQTSNRT